MRTTETDQLEEPLAREMPTLRLLFSGDAGVSGRLYVLAESPLLIGREIADSAGIGLPLDGRMSRSHARLEVGSFGSDFQLRPPVCIVDLDSKNGTFVNGVQSQRLELRDGDVIRCGNSFFLLRYEQARRVDAEAEPLLGQAPSMRSLRSRLLQAARESQTILLLGETGAGKEVATQAIHRASGRQGPLIAVNCAAIPNELAESQLFGHMAGAFSGARTSQPGFFRAAEGGTLFLDEIGDLPAGLQAKLLRALEERAVVPVGATQPVRCDVRVVAATNRDLQKDVKDGGFRADLYGRLCGAVLTLPPLRERREDILPLLIKALAPQAQHRISARLAEALLLHDWPFNVRELVQIAGLLKPHLHETGFIDLPLVYERLKPCPPKTPAAHLAGSTSSGAEQAAESLLTPEALTRLYREHEGNISKLSRLIGLSRRHVRRMLERYGIHGL